MMRTRQHVSCLIPLFSTCFRCRCCYFSITEISSRLLHWHVIHFMRTPCLFAACHWDGMVAKTFCYSSGYRIAIKNDFYRLFVPIPKFHSWINKFWGHLDRYRCGMAAPQAFVCFFWMAVINYYELLPDPRISELITHEYDIDCEFSMQKIS